MPLASKHILIVEDSDQIRKLLAQALEIEGYSVVQARDGAVGLRYLQQLAPDLILTDFSMPNMSGVEFYQAVRANPMWGAIPFIFLTAQEAPEEIEQTKELGVEDYLVKPVDPQHLVKVVNARLLRAAELRAALIDQAYLETIKVLANTIEGRDPYTHGHVERVTIYAQWLAEALEWPQENLRMLAFGARLHDIGKIAIPDHILNKRGGLTPEEWEMMRQHPIRGAKILQNIKHLQPAIPYVLYHHERWDGSGYPHGLKGRDIPIEGRLLAIVDVYDALTTARPYHPARPRHEVYRHLTSGAGTLFDPDLVPLFLEALQKRARI